MNSGARDTDDGEWMAVERDRLPTTDGSAANRRRLPAGRSIATTGLRSGHSGHSSVEEAAAERRPGPRCGEVVPGDHFAEDDFRLSAGDGRAVIRPLQPNTSATPFARSRGETRNRDMTCPQSLGRNCSVV